MYSECILSNSHLLDISKEEGRLSHDCRTRFANNGGQHYRNCVFRQQWKNVLPPRFFIYFAQKEVTMERPRGTGYITRLWICRAPGITSDPLLSETKNVTENWIFNHFGFSVYLVNIFEYILEQLSLLFAPKRFTLWLALYCSEYFHTITKRKSWW